MTKRDTDPQPILMTPAERRRYVDWCFGMANTYELNNNLRMANYLRSCAHLAHSGCVAIDPQKG